MQIRFQPEAEAELAEARVWYALQREGLDDALMQRVDEALQRILRARTHIKSFIDNSVARCSINSPLRFFTSRPMTKFEYLPFITPAVIRKS